jgi:tungstate transport system substrate-binding protein
MHNDFVFLGSPTDPANINNADSLAQVMLKIHNASSTFISRGDDSGTHNKEMELWQSAKLSPAGTWYLSVGQSMGAVLQIANEKLAYTLTDRGTYLAFMDKIELQILYEQDPALFNRYHIILVNPQRHAHTRIESARKYSAFIRSEIGQNLIRDFRINGEPLFYPDVIK